MHLVQANGERIIVFWLTAVVMVNYVQCQSLRTSVDGMWTQTSLPVRSYCKLNFACINKGQIHKIIDEVNSLYSGKLRQNLGCWLEIILSYFWKFHLAMQFRSFIKRMWFSIVVFPKTSNLYLSAAVPPHCFWEQKYSWFLVLLITCKFDFSCQVVNTDVEITPGHILWRYTFTTESRVWAPNSRTQFFHFSAFLNTAAVLEILACIAVKVPTELVRWVQTIIAEDSSKDMFILATFGFHWPGYQNKLHWQKLLFPSISQVCAWGPCMLGNYTVKESLIWTHFNKYM